MGWKTLYFSAGSGAFFATGAGANILAQLFFTPSGIMLDVTEAAAAVVEAIAPEPHESVAGAAPHESSPDAAGLVSHEEDVSAGVSHALASTAGAGTIFSLREPFVCEVPRPPRPPLPRSVPRPRPLPPSKPDRPPAVPELELPNVETVASLTFDLARSFFESFETAPHCEIVPNKTKLSQRVFFATRKLVLRVRGGELYHLLCALRWSLNHHRFPAMQKQHPHLSSRETSL